MGVGELQDLLLQALQANHKSLLMTYSELLSINSVGRRKLMGHRKRKLLRDPLKVLQPTTTSPHSRHGRSSNNSSPIRLEETAR